MARASETPEPISNFRLGDDLGLSTEERENKEKQEELAHLRKEADEFQQEGRRSAPLTFSWLGPPCTVRLRLSAAPASPAVSCQPSSPEAGRAISGESSRGPFFYLFWFRSSAAEHSVAAIFFCFPRRDDSRSLSVHGWARCEPSVCGSPPPPRVPPRVVATVSPEVQKQAGRSALIMADRRALWEQAVVALFDDTQGATTAIHSQSRTISNIIFELEKARTLEFKKWWEMTSLTKYIENGRVPQGLWILILPTLGDIDPDLLEQWRSYTADCSAKLMGTLITQAKRRMEEQTQVIDRLMKELEKMGNSQEVQQLLMKMEERIKKKEDEIKTHKALKFNRDKKRL
ncbi:hypothetical protein NDU88_006358 [Pleurodeles waltl]|uniref:Uncharacterized protein n=1 Tax=Pleurodeles waltl TaxID=8319 RepID=A0AAV7MBZ1_PLEWA|nr:hypothetical protein NDU88_006358 [Pleurodeles waltl]